MSMADRSVDVLVVGAGPVGLSLAGELASRGHRVLVVEKADRLGRQPRAKTTNVRTMQHMRRWGISEAVRRASPLPADHANRVLFATGLFGHEITAFENVFNADRVRDERFPEAAQWIPQYEIERLLHERAIGFPSCTLRLGTTLIGFEEDAEGVVVTVEEGGERSTVRARYLVGADGARSRVRELLGVRMEGDGRIARFLSLVLRVPGLARRRRVGEALMYWIVDPKSPCILGPMDRDDTWFWGAQLPPDAPLDEASNRARVEAALGADAAFDILVTDLWTASRLQANSYGTGRVLLAGDACHLHPPFGGYGMNLGIGDAVDLGWKLSAALEGWAGPELIASYEAERRPVHARVIDEATENMGMLMQHFANPRLDDDDDAGRAARSDAAVAIQAVKDREFHSLGLVLGYDYEGSPIIVDDGSATSERAVAEFTPSARPGRLAPHAWMPDGSSLFDHLGPGFTLLRLGPTQASITPFLEAARRSGVPLQSLEVGDDALRAAYGAPLVLVRPDQHVAWRGADARDAALIVDRARGVAAGS